EEPEFRRIFARDSAEMTEHAWVEVRAVSPSATGVTVMTDSPAISGGTLIDQARAADNALQRRMGREGYILGYSGFGAFVGESAPVPHGAIMGAAVAGIVAYYRSRPRRS